MSTNTRFVSVGYGYVLNAGQVWAVVRNGSRVAGRVIGEAKRANKFLDFTAKHPCLSIAMLNNGYSVGLAFSSKTIMGRLNAASTDDAFLINPGNEVMRTDVIRDIEADENSAGSTYADTITFLEDEDDGEYEDPAENEAAEEEEEDE